MDKDKSKVVAGIKLGIRIITTMLVDTFFTAATSGIMNNTKGGGKIAKIGVKTGKILTGLFLGGQVSDYICDTFDDVMGMNEDDDEEE